MWKVLSMFNETDEENGEETVVVERTFEQYWEMRNYVVTCESQGAVGGFVMRYNPRDKVWYYYMDVQ